MNKLLIIIALHLFTPQIEAKEPPGGINDFPVVDESLKKQVIEPYNCPISQEEIRLDKSSNGEPPIIRTGVIDQGRVGDCYAATGITLLESELNKRTDQGIELSYLASSIQTKTRRLEDDLNDEIKSKLEMNPDPKLESENEIITADHKKKFLKDYLPEGFLSQINASEVNDLYVGFKSIKNAKEQDKTVLDSGAICDVVNTISKEKYCPKKFSPIEIAVQHEKTKLYEPNTKLNKQGDLSFLSLDKKDLQVHMLKSLEDFYMSMMALKIMRKSSQHDNQSEAKALFSYWENKLIALTGQNTSNGVQNDQLISSILMCSEFGSIGGALNDGFDNLKKVMNHLEKDYVQKIIRSLVDGSGNEDYSLKNYLLSLMTPECVDPLNRVEIKPKITCTAKAFPSFPVRRDLNEREKKRKEIWDKKLTDIYDYYAASVNDKNKEYLCSMPFLKQYGGLCNGDKIKSLGEFKKDALVTREERVKKELGSKYTPRHLWATASEIRTYDFENGKNNDIALRINNAQTMIKEFDVEVLDALKTGKPVGLGICDAVLINNFTDGAHGGNCQYNNGQKGGNHAVTVVGVRKSSGGCQYLIKDSRGTDMRPYNQRCKSFNDKVAKGIVPGEDGEPLSGDCEPGLIWVEADQIAVNTFEISKIN